MRLDVGAGRGRFALDADTRWLLAERVAAALRLARVRNRPAMASVTVEVPAELDLSAAVLAARRRDDRYFCLEQPERDAFALAALGEATRAEASGEDRFTLVADSVQALGEHALAGDPGADPAAPPGSGPVWVGGFAFAPRGGASPEWSELAPAQLVLPELSLARFGDEARLTVTAVVEGDEAAEAVVERLARRAAELAPARMPLADPHPLEQARVVGALPPEHYEAAVARAVELIGAGQLGKVVLAREVRVHSARDFDPAAIFDGLRTAFPGCFCFLAGTPATAFVGASPELLVRREGARLQTVALAGTTRRSADPAVDDLLGEQLLRSPKERHEHAIVSERIRSTLDPVSLWVAAADEPVLVRVQNVQHLATPIRAQLAEPLPALRLAGLLHPTPAVGGEPWTAAEPLIPALEGMDRGWYAGPLGWTDLTGDGELCVALRCALLRGRVAHLYAGDGIVRDSVPSDELAETEIKLEALLPLLT